MHMNYFEKLEISFENKPTGISEVVMWQEPGLGP